MRDPTLRNRTPETLNPTLPNPKTPNKTGLHTQTLHKQTNTFDAPSEPKKEPKWVQIKLPTGALVNVLVDEHDRIVAQKPMEASMQDVF